MVGQSYNISGGVIQHAGPSSHNKYITHHHTHIGGNEECMRILDWLAPNDTEDKQQNIFMAYQNGTYSWFFESKKFTSWLTDDEANATLWCYGDPGVGKTVLSSAIIEHIRDMYANDDTVGIAIAYCTYGDASANTSQPILGSIARQLALQDGKLHPRVEQEYKNIMKRTRTTSSTIGLANLQKLITSLVTSFQKVYVVVDGIDECEKEDRANLLVVLQQVKSAVGSHARFLATSRPHAGDIKRAFKTACHIHIRPQTEDLKEFVKIQLYNDGDLLSLAQSKPANESELNDEDDLEKLILESTPAQASGMFLMASLQMKRLKQAKTRRDLKKALQSIPPNLDAMYAEALDRISNQTGLQPKRGLSVLTWMLNARRPLQATELIHALAMEEACDGIDEPLPLDFDWSNTLKQEDLLDICAGMVTVEPKHKTVQFVHATALKYLERQRGSQLWLVRIKMARICMAYLSLGELARGPCGSDEELEKRVVKFSLLTYAGSFWGAHLRLVDQHHFVTTGNLRDGEDAYDKIQKQTRGFLQNQRAVMSANQVLHMPAFRLPNYSQLYPKHVEPLHMAALFGLSNLLVLLLDAEDGKAINIDSKDSSGWTALHRAAENGHIDAVEVLVTRGCSINQCATFGGTALHRAAKNGHLEIARLLLSNDAAVDEEDNYGGTPLHRAARGGHVNVAALLLDQGADKARPYNLETTLGLMMRGALIRAKLITDTFQPLAMVAARDQAAARVEAELAAQERLRGGTALHEAAGAGSIELVRLLLERGADVEAVDNFHGTVLHRAAAGGHAAVIEALIDEAGAALNTKCHYGMLARRLTSLTSSENNAKFGVDEFAFSIMTGATALHEAARNGHEGAARTLIDRGADVNNSGTYIDSALSEAAANGHVGVVQMLLDAGADVDNSSSVSLRMIRGTALHAAAENGREQVVRALLCAGASVNALRGSEESQCTPLLLAARAGHETTARVLLERGAEVDWVNETTERTALSEAAEHGNVRMVELLLGHGADQRTGNESLGVFQSLLNPMASERGPFTPLLLAVEKGHVDVVRLLLRYGAQANWSGDAFFRSSILRAAVSSGSKGTVQAILAAGVDPNSGPCLHKAIESFTRRTSKANRDQDEHVGLIELLVEAGADVGTIKWGSTALHEAAAAGQDGVATLLLGYGADVNTLDSQEQTPLYKAAIGGHLSTMLLLLAAGARIELESNPLHGAVRGGHESVAATLIQHGATIDEATHGKTLVEAAGNGVESVVRLLLEKGIPDEDEPKRKALLAAAQRGHGAVVDLLLQNGAPLEGKDEGSGRTPLLLATIAGHESLAITLVDSRGADPAVRDAESGRTLLSWAAERGMEALVSLILSRAGADSIAGDVTAVSSAANNGHLAIVKRLAASGAKYYDDMQNVGFPSIGRIAEAGNKDVAMELFRLYATEDLVDRKFGLMLSVVCDDLKYASELLEHGVKVEADWNILIYAARNGNQALLKLLLEAGERTNLVDALEISLKEGNFTIAPLLAKMAPSELEDHDLGRVLVAAAEAECEDVVRYVVERYSAERWTDYVEKAVGAATGHGHLGILKLLLEKTGFTLDLANDDHVKILRSGLSYDHLIPLLLAAVSTWPTEGPVVGKILSQVCAVGNLQAAEFLLNKGTSLNGDPSTMTPLHYACLRGNLAIASMLLKRGAAVDTQDPEYGQTGLSFAIQMAHSSVARLLIEKGADVNTKRDDDGNTLLIYAAMTGNEIGARLLLKEGNAAPDMANNSGKTPLISAVEAGNGAVARVLLEYGANIEAVDEEGRTALHHAAFLGRKTTARILLEHPGAVGLVYRQDNNGDTPLSLAKEREWVRFEELLLETVAVERETGHIHEGRRVADVQGGESDATVVEAGNEEQHRLRALEKQDHTQDEEDIDAEPQMELLEDEVVGHDIEKMSSQEGVTTATTKRDSIVEEIKTAELGKEFAQNKKNYFLFWSWLSTCILLVILSQLIR